MHGGLVLKNRGFAGIVHPVSQSHTFAPEPEPASPAPEPIAVVVGEVDERALLIKCAEEKGVHIDKRWNTNKIRAAVEHA